MEEALGQTLHHLFHVQFREFSRNTQSFCRATRVEVPSPSLRVGPKADPTAARSPHVCELPFGRLHPGRTPISTALGVLGMPGMTAYPSLTIIGQPKAGETVAAMSWRSRRRESELRLVLIVTS
jgi:hypothetical protein